MPIFLNHCINFPNVCTNVCIKMHICHIFGQIFVFINICANIYKHKYLCLNIFVQIFVIFFKYLFKCPSRSYMIAIKEIGQTDSVLCGNTLVVSPCYEGVKLDLGFHFGTQFQSIM